MTDHLHLSGVSHGYGDRELFHAVDLAIHHGEHVAIVGENGAGKSTLLRLMAGVETPDDGTAGLSGNPPGYRVGYLAQTHGFSESLTVGDAIDTSLASLRSLERASWNWNLALPTPTPKNSSSTEAFKPNTNSVRATLPSPGWKQRWTSWGWEAWTAVERLDLCPEASRGG